MAGDDCAIFVAINDNHRAWYEMLVPFMLSLKGTDFGGHVVVIDYGLSAAKLALLQREGIQIAPASADCDLSVGRYLEVARVCAANPVLTKAALYDADIWFCTETFDLFDRIRDDRLHVCPDPMFASFVYEPLIGPRQEENTRRVIDDVVGRYGGALQAGLVAGSTAAWAAFAAHLQACLDRVGTDFQLCFGLDTTFLHLWAAEHEVCLLPETQNFITKRGVTETFVPGRRQPIWLTAGETVRAMHMCGDVRFYDRWRYYTNHCDHALREGTRFALSEAVPELLPASHALYGAEARDRLAERGLALTGLSIENPATAVVGLSVTGAGLCLHACGNHEIVLEAIRDIPRIDFHASYPAGFPSAIRRTFTIGDQVIRNLNQLSAKCSATLVRGSTAVLSAESLSGQRCETTWVLCDDPGLAP